MTDYLKKPIYTEAQEKQYRSFLEFHYGWMADVIDINTFPFGPLRLYVLAKYWWNDIEMVRIFTYGAARKPLARARGPLCKQLGLSCKEYAEYSVYLPKDWVDAHGGISENNWAVQALIEVAKQSITDPNWYGDGQVFVPSPDIFERWDKPFEGAMLAPAKLLHGGIRQMELDEHSVLSFYALAFLTGEELDYQLEHKGASSYEVLSHFEWAVDAIMFDPDRENRLKYENSKQRYN